MVTQSDANKREGAKKNEWTKRGRLVFLKEQEVQPIDWRQKRFMKERQLPNPLEYIVKQSGSRDGRRPPLCSRVLFQKVAVT